MAFSPDGFSIVSGSVDKTIQINSLLCFKYVAAAVHNDVLCPDIASCKESESKFDWENSNSGSILYSNFDVLCNTREDDGSHQNMIHVAADKDCASFLSFFLDLERFSSNNEKFAALAACLTKDAKGKTPLHFAVKSQNLESMKIILDVLLCAYSDQFVIHKEIDFHLLHLFELIPFTTDIIDLVEKFPALGLKFFDSLSLVDNYEKVVKKDCPKAPISEGEVIVLGSLEERTPESTVACNELTSSG